MQVYGEGTGFECRKHVQHLNLMRKTMDEQTPQGDSMQHDDTDTPAVVSVDDAQNHVVNFTNTSVIYFLSACDPSKVRYFRYFPPSPPIDSI